MKRNDKEMKPIFLDGHIVDISINGMVGFSDLEKKFIIRSLQLKLDVLNSIEFRDALLALKLNETNGFKNSDIYNMIVAGRSKYSQADGDLDYFLVAYSSRKTVLGYVLTTSYKSWHNLRFIRSWMKDIYGTAKCAGHLLHEQLHLMNFGHKTHKGSVPYEVGYLCRDLGMRIIKGQKLTPLKKVI